MSPNRNEFFALALWVPTEMILALKLQTGLIKDQRTEKFNNKSDQGVS